ncbi:MAG: prolyl oligopeptidase family serine peptidase [Gemmatimonadetes bacterium]|nr:prolyl oligopeptidase family serine peptidase [Gemmatimonadota bacterium]
MNPLVFGTGVRPSWLDDGRFWYRIATPDGHEFMIVDPVGRTRERAFDHARLAGALSEAAGESFHPFALPFSAFTMSPDGRSITFDSGVRTYACDISRYECSYERRQVGRAAGPLQSPRGRGMTPGVASPDGMKSAFIRDHNLWMRDTESGEETQLTADGVEDFGYATNNAGWTKSDRPVLLWSPDSKKIATFQHDGRGVGMMYLVTTKVGHPELEAWKYPLPEDSVIFRIHRVVIDVDNPDSPKVVRLEMPPDQHRSTICDHIYCNGAFSDVEWAPDGSQLAFVSSSRDHKEAQLRVADPETGVVRDVLYEREETYYESGEDMVNWHFFPEYNEVVWFSERTNWGHLYLYDLQTGELKHPITSGDGWRVLQVRHVDRENRMLYFTGSGKEPGDPYFQYLYSVNMDGGDVRLLTPDSANHDITFSPDFEYFVDAYSTPLDPGATVLRDMRGREVVQLQTGDILQLRAAGWQPPIPFSVKARDGVTDLYGIMFKPSHLDPAKKYPVVNYLYPGPQSGSVGSRSFSAARREHQAMAELGFVVVTVDAMGTPGRSKSFHDIYYGNMGDNGLPDQIAAIEELASRNPWMDLDRVGIWGGSGGGFASTAGILRYPDFYKVAVSTSGNHDNRNYEDDWGEKWQGLLETFADGTTNYDNQANQLVAGNLKGKLLLAHGSMDSNVPPYNTMVVVDALIAANKDFDLLLLPNRGHGLGEPYMVRRRWDYFVEHLLGSEPPKEYPMGGR